MDMDKASINSKCFARVLIVKRKNIHINSKCFASVLIVKRKNIHISSKCFARILIVIVKAVGSDNRKSCSSGYLITNKQRHYLNTKSVGNMGKAGLEVKA